MKIVCAIDATALSCNDIDILVLPEGISTDALHSASARFKNTIVVGAAKEGKYMRAYALHRGHNLIDYLKIGSDGRSTGTGQTPQISVHVAPNFVMGVMVCIDAYDIRFRPHMLDALSRSDRAIKIICVPADISKDSYQSEPVGGFNGIYLAMSNNNVTYMDKARAKSFVTDREGRWLVRQNQFEPICAELA